MRSGTSSVASSSPYGPPAQGADAWRRTRPLDVLLAVVNGLVAVLLGVGAVVLRSPEAGAAALVVALLAVNLVVTRVSRPPVDGRRIRLEPGRTVVPFSRAGDVTLVLALVAIVALLALLAWAPSFGGRAGLLRWLAVIGLLTLGSVLPDILLRATRATRLVLTPDGVAARLPDEDVGARWEDVTGVTVAAGRDGVVVRIQLAGSDGVVRTPRRRVLWRPAPTPWIDVPLRRAGATPEGLVGALRRWQQLPASRSRLGTQESVADLTWDPSRGTSLT